MRDAMSRFVDALSEEQGNRVLRRKLRPGRIAYSDGSACLVGAAEGWQYGSGGAFHKFNKEPLMDAVVRARAANEFDRECCAREVAVVAAEIRDRILENRAKALASLPTPTKQEVVHA